MNSYQNPMQPVPVLARWSRQVQLPSSGIRLHLYDNGAFTKPPVLLIHGLGDEADTWRHIFPKIAEDYRVIAPDLPGFGRSEFGKAGNTIPFLIDALIELLDQLSIPRAHLVGHSAGAVIAQALALNHPQRFEKLVLIDGTLISGENKLNLGLLLFMVPGLGEWSYKRLRKDPQAAYRTLAPYYYRLDDLPQEERDFLFQRVNERVWSDSQRRGFFSLLRGLVSWLPGQQKGLPARLRASNIPTTILWGEHDQINSVANARALAAVLPSARLEIIPEAGHNLHQEKPEVVISAIRQ